MVRMHGEELPEHAGLRLLESQNFNFGQVAQIVAVEMVEKIFNDQKKVEMQCSLFIS